jgi:hypothetical protein
MPRYLNPVIVREIRTSQARLVLARNLEIRGKDTFGLAGGKDG